MDTAIKNLKFTTFSGKRFTRKQLASIQKTVSMFPKLSRRELAHTICEHFKWQTPNGTDSIQSCLGALEQMEKLNIISLPNKVENKNKAQNKNIIWTDHTKEQPLVADTLQNLMPIRLESVLGTEPSRQWNEFVDRYHYLGYKRPMGTHMRYYILDRHNRKLGCLLFSFASWLLPCRDKWIGWDVKTREKNINLVINNNRFLIFPWVKVKNLASKALSIAARQVGDDWWQHHGYRPALLETFVDPEKYDGTCYQASNWQLIGETAGRRASKNTDGKSRKKVYSYPLIRNFRQVLMNTGKTKSIRKQAEISVGNKLNSNDPFVRIWQNILWTVSKVTNDFDKKWQKRQRLLNTLLVMLFIFRLVFSKGKQGYSLTITELWDQCRIMNIGLPQAKPVSPSAFCNARAKLDEQLFKILNTEIINEQAEAVKWKGHCLYAVDGTKINVPMHLIKSGYRKPSDNAHYPQALVSCLYRLNEKIPVDFNMAAHGNERTSALQHLQAIKENDVIIYDRGYFSYTMLYTHTMNNVHAIFRIQKNTYKCIDAFISSSDVDRVVTIEVLPENQRKMAKENLGIKFIPIKLRLVKYAIGNETYIIGTTLMDNQIYSIDELANCYYARWGIEELYKISKVLIDVEDFHAQSERGIKQELFAHFTLITISRLFSNYSEGMLTQNQQSSGDKQVKVNFKNCLLTVARNLESLFLQHTSWLKKTIHTVIVSISNCRQKIRPNRNYERVSKKPVKKWRSSSNRNPLANCKVLPKVA